MRKLDKKAIEEIARKVYFKTLMLERLEEIKRIEKGEIKALEGKEIDEFFKKLGVGD